MTLPFYIHKKREQAEPVLCIFSIMTKLYQ
jgi:hypothetical protein